MKYFNNIKAHSTPKIMTQFLDFDNGFIPVCFSIIAVYKNKTYILLH